MIDLDKLSTWLDATDLPGKGAPLDAQLLSGGAQNEIYELRRGELHCVLRIPPVTAPESRDAGILREWKIIAGLKGTDVPHTAALAVCEDTSVLGRPFYLMEHVDGWSPMTSGKTWPEPFNSDLEARPGLAFQLTEGIALLSKVDWSKEGLVDLGRPDGFHERQVDRWSNFFEKSKGRELPGMEATSAWLRARKPLDYIPGLMHGDYQFANVMYRHGGPAKLAAIIDWEMGTVGDPKLDLGWMLTSWPDGSSEGGSNEYVDMTGMPSRDQVLAHYSEISGRQVDDIDYYLVLAKWKLAIMLEQTYQRAKGHPKLDALGALVPGYMKSAADVAESSDYRG